jgi:hypothetical protein
VYEKAPKAAEHNHGIKTNHPPRYAVNGMALLGQVGRCEHPLSKGERYGQSIHATAQI